MEKLIVRNFGPIKKAKIELKKFNILVGHTSTGKSAIAKLFSIVNSSQFFSIQNGDFDSFNKLLSIYNIDFEFKKNTEIVFEKSENTWKIQNNTFETNWEHTAIFSAAKDAETNRDFLKRILNDKSTDWKRIFPKQAQNEEFIDAYMNLIRFIVENESTNFAEAARLVRSQIISSLTSMCDPIYIPAERNLITLFTDNIYGFIGAKINLPECIMDFGASYQKAKTNKQKIDISFMDAAIEFSIQGDKLILQKEKNKTMPLRQSSSGFQSIIPLLSVFDYVIESTKEEKLFVIEEPELSLFPSAQTKLIEHIVKGINNNKKNNIIITTHSPYVLSVFDNLVLAHNIGQQRGKKGKTDDIISIDMWIDINKISSYYFDSDGVVKDIIDKEDCSIGAEYIDGASNETGKTFEQLLDLM